MPAQYDHSETVRLCIMYAAARMNTSMDLRHAFLSLSAVITCRLMLCKMSEKSFLFERERMDDSLCLNQVIVCVCAHCESSSGQVGFISTKPGVN